MQRCGTRGVLWVVVLTVVLVMPVAWAGASQGEAGAAYCCCGALGWDTNFTWLQSRSGMLDKRPALEYLIGIDRNTGAYIPELAEKWAMAPDGKSWTITLRKGVKFHEKWGNSPPRTCATHSSSSRSLIQCRPMPDYGAR